MGTKKKERYKTRLDKKKKKKKHNQKHRTHVSGDEGSQSAEIHSHPVSFPSPDTIVLFSVNANFFEFLLLSP